MSKRSVFPNRSTDAFPALSYGFSALLGMAYAGADLVPVWKSLAEQRDRNPADGACLIDLSTIAQICDKGSLRADLQREALKLSRVYRHPSRTAERQGLRLLAFMVPGSFMANTPLELLLDDLDVSLHIAYVTEDAPLPPRLPDHDLAFVTIAESKNNERVLRALTPRLAGWERPVLNAPNRIVGLTRDAVSVLLAKAPGVTIPPTASIGRATLSRIARGEILPGSILDGAAFPLIGRPRDSHAGEGLSKIEDAAEVAAFLTQRSEDEFYISPFIDYRSRDGLFRKFRIVFIDGQAYPCHMAISSDWMIHYVNAGMLTRAERRAEEAKFMAEFDLGFAVRHKAAIDAIAERVRLDYFAVDCAEMPDGRLLVFEAGNAMVVHDLDPPEIFPYKRQHMDTIFRAFGNMLQRHVQHRVVGRATN